MRATAPAQKDGPRVNDEIRNREVQLIDHEGNNRGVIQTHEAIALAKEAGLDLVEISPNTSPPVAKILDYGKYNPGAEERPKRARSKTVESRR